MPSARLTELLGGEVEGGVALEAAAAATAPSDAAAACRAAAAAPPPTVHGVVGGASEFSRPRS